MKKKNLNKQQALVALILFGIVMLGFTISTVWEYFYFRGGEQVEAEVTDIDRYGSSRHRKYRATVEFFFDETLIEKQVPLERNGVSIGNLRVTSSDIHEGDVIDIIVVRTEDDYDTAVAYDVRNPWPELTWLLVSLALTLFALIMLVRGDND